MGYMPSDGGGDRRGMSLRGKLVYTFLASLLVSLAGLFLVFGTCVVVDLRAGEAELRILHSEKGLVPEAGEVRFYGPERIGAAIEAGEMDEEDLNQIARDVLVLAERVGAWDRPGGGLPH